MDLEQLASYLHRDVREVSKMASRGYLPGHKIGGPVGFDVRRPLTKVVKQGRAVVGTPPRGPGITALPLDRGVAEQGNGRGLRAGQGPQRLQGLLSVLRRPWWSFGLHGIKHG